jgi:tetratricopeptide (TPR) repeat protein
MKSTRGSMNTSLKRNLLLIAFTGLFFSCASYLNTQLEEFTTSDLLGMIYDNHNQACPGVRVSVDGFTGPLSDVNGRFTLPNVSRGAHKLSAKKEGYEECSFDIEFLNRTQIVYLKVFSFEQILELAENAIEDRKLGQAEEHLNRAKGINESDPLLLYLRAVIALKRDQVKDALSIFLSIIEQNTAEPHVYLAIADIYEYKLKDFPNALKYLKKYSSYNESDEIQERIKRVESTSK